MSISLLICAVVLLQGGSYIFIANLILRKQTLRAAAFHKLRNAMLSHLDEDGLQDDGEPTPNVGLERTILKPSDNLSGEGFHNGELRQRVKNR